MERKKKYVATLSCIGLAALSAFCSTSGLSASDAQPWPLTLRSQMARLSDVGYRIGVVAAPLCPSTVSGTGIGLDYIESYEAKDRAAIAMLLNMTNAPQIASVAVGSPAETAGIEVGDDVVAINGKAIDELRFASADTSLFADELERYLAAMPKGMPMRVDLRRKGKAVETKVVPVPVCAARFVIKTGIGITAFSDGNNVAVSSKLIGFTHNDDELALIAAHEIGHIINRDGKAGSLNERRRMEDRADSLGVRLMHCAGYVPEAGFQFWLRRDATDWLRMLRDPTHRSRKSRVKLMREEDSDARCPPALEFRLSKS